MVHGRGCLPGFYEIQRINENVGFAGRASNKSYKSCKRPNMNPVIYMLITQHYATYKELRDDYDVNEMLDMYEACCINMYNKAEAMNNDG